MLISSQKGFSLFELTIVMIVIAILMKLYVDAIGTPIDNSQKRTLEFQAATFARAVENLRGIASIKQVNVVLNDDVNIYVNEFGWPANTVAAQSPHSKNQTAEECLQLWYGIFQNPPKAVLKGNSNKQVGDYFVSSINAHICHFELAISSEANYYFEYDVKNGTVVVSTE